MPHPFDELTREELLALAKEQQSELQQLRAHAAAPAAEIAEAGSIADTAAKISGILQAAQQTADIYLQSTKALQDRQESAYSLRLAEAEQEAQTLLQETQERCRKAIAHAEASAAYYWTELQQRLDAFWLENPFPVLPSRPAAEETDEGFGPDD